MMLNANTTLEYLCAKTINTTFYLHNKIYIPLIKKTHYELWKDRKLNMFYL